MEKVAGTGARGGDVIIQSICSGWPDDRLDTGSFWRWPLYAATHRGGPGEGLSGRTARRGRQGEPARHALRQPHVRRPAAPIDALLIENPPVKIVQTFKG